MLQVSAKAHWQRFQRLGARHRRAWEHFSNRQRILTARADPRTAGHPGNVHNWGNEEAQRIERSGWARWHGFSEASRKAQTDALRERERAMGGNPVW